MSIYKNGKLIAGGRQTMPLLSFMWADHQLNDVSWLRADTFSWHTGNKTTGVYLAAYKHLYEETRCWGWYNPNLTPDIGYTRGLTVAVGDPVYSNNTLSTQIGTVSAVDLTSTPKTITFNGNTYRLYIEDNIASTTETVAGITITYFPAPDGHKICLANQESAVAAIYAATGVAWYYIIDTANQRFKLPRVNPNKVVLSGDSAPIKWYSDSSVPQSALSKPALYSSSGALQTGSGQGYILGNSSGGGISFNGVGGPIAYNSPLYMAAIADLSQPSGGFVGKKYLYFYVGQFTQTALENTAGLNAELFNSKVDVGHQVVEFQEPTAANNYTWYRKYADGWVEQGGRKSNNTGTCTLPVEMSDTNYTILTLGINNGISNNFYNILTYNITTTSFYYDWSGESTNPNQICFFVSGMAAN